MSPGAKQLVWLDGRVRRRDEAGIPVDDSAYAEGRGCYTTARIRGGRVAFEEHHVRRLARGAAGLRLGALDALAVRHALRDLAKAAFPDGEGIVRVQVSRGEPRARVVGVPRELGEERAVWSAVCAKTPHEGPIVAGSHKLTNRLVLALAMDEARDAGADEALLFDRDGRLVEGTRSNVVAVTRAGRLVTPPLARGAVAGVARQVLCERVPELAERDLRRADLLDAHAVFCTNAVRGARRVGRLDGRPLVGDDDAAAPWSARLSEVLEATE